MRKDIPLFFWEIAKIIIIAMLIVLPIRYFIFQPFIIKQQSMEPNFFEKDYLIVDQITYRLNQPKRGEVIVFNDPNNSSQKYIKRIIGLPGETIKIKDGNVYILKADKVFHFLEESAYLPEGTVTRGDQQWDLGDGQYFVLGDNRSFSSDSRDWGHVKEEYIIGRAFLRLWPFSAIAKMEAPAYIL